MLSSQGIADSVLDLVGATPLVRLSRLMVATRTPVLAKAEMLNPGGSIKDRPALAMIEAAEHAGLLLPGGTIVEPTSGNTGVGLAMAATLKGYRVIAVMPDKMSQEKIDLLRAYGAEVVICPTAVEPEDPASYYSVSKRLTADTPGAFNPNQYFNPANPQSHYDSTGPEIWEQTEGRITHLVAGLGTGGTISGIGRYLKEQNPQIQVIGADPVGSIYSGGPVHSYSVEGIGEDFWPGTFDPKLVDRYIVVSDRDSYLMARRLVTTEGLLAGGSSGTALVAADEVAAELDDPQALMVVVLPDGGRSYLSKVFNDEWMTTHGYLAARQPRIVADLIAARDRSLPPLLSVDADGPVRAALALMQEYGVSQLPVKAASGELVGSLSEGGLLRAQQADRDLLDRTVGEVKEPLLAQMSEDAPAEDAIALLSGAASALVVVDGHGSAKAVLTRVDVIDAMTR